MLRQAIVTVVTASSRRPWLVIVLAAVLGIGAVFYTGRHIAIDTNSVDLLPADLPWRQKEIAFDAAFPQLNDLIVVVIDGATPELAEQASATLYERLRAQPTLFQEVRRPDGGPFFEHNGLLFLPVEQVRQTTESLIAAQPLLGTLAADPSMRGLMQALALSAEGVRRHEAQLADLQRPLTALSATLEGVIAGHATPLSWRSLITGQPADARELRRFILMQPRLDFESLQPGERASSAIRAAAQAAGLTTEHGVRVRLTGQIPLADEEFATLAQGVVFNTSLTIALVALLLWLALRSLRIIAAVLVSLLLGLAVTAAFGLLAVGAFNLISVAFAVLFVGLGVDFGIQFCVRYRAERHAQGDLHAALHGAASGVGVPLALAAAATAAGFYAFLPTEYRGVSQLGLIAGTGMLLAFAATVTVLPALLAVLEPRGEAEAIGYARLAALDRFLVTHRRAVLVASGVIAGGCLVSLAWLRFDFNPLNLRSPKTESVSTALDLMRDPQTTPSTIDVLAPSLAAAKPIAQRLEKLPEVLQVITLESFVPDNQDAKLALLSDAALLLDPTLNPGSIAAEPDDAEVVAAMRSAADGLRDVSTTADDAAAQAAKRFVHALDAFIQGTPALRSQASAALIPGLRVTLDQLRAALQAQAVTVESLPPELARDWISADRRARIEIYPRGNSNDNEVLKRFVTAVRAIAPDATGMPVSVQESSRTIVRAFIEAGVLALLAIAILLWLALRRVRDVALTLAPLLLSGLLTLGASVVLRLPLNFANIIALPLLFGIGVAFNIYFIMAWREGATGLLQSSLTRAVLFSALTTASAFGTLWLSAHPGTASMGELLAISLVCTLIAALVFLPALLGAAGPEKPKAN
jgi:hopanoid biosynthesis associated RND transporter like protein HpnN